MGYSSKMNSSDWQYCGEGGKHAVFAYRPIDRARARWRGEWVDRLLRIEKSVLAWSSVDSVRVPSECNAGSLIVDGFQAMVCAALQPYIDQPEFVVLKWEFVAALRQHTLDGEKIPHRRRRDWFNDEKSTGTNVEPHGFLIRDYRVSMNLTPGPSSQNSRCFSLEIKPKAGYTAFSPCVDETHAERYTHSRFVLLQKLYAKGTLTKDWMGNSSDVFEETAYDPIDLFSCDGDRIRSSLRSMITCPQNNLKVWIGDRLVLGAAKQQDAKQLYEGLFDWRSLAQVFKLDGASQSEISAMLVELTAVVLIEEPFLSLLIALQKLDILDGDGAVHVFRRLVAFCDGCTERAEQLVDCFPPQFSLPPPRQPHMLLHNAPLMPPQETEHITSLCVVIESTCALLKKSSDGSQTNMEQLRRFRRRSLEIIDCLSAQECTFLLQTWLLSLTMCDVSFFVTFRGPVLDVDLDGRSSPYCVRTRQGRGSPGFLTLRSGSSGTSIVRDLPYELKVIDFDKKPAQKLRSRHIKEAIFGKNPILG